MTTTSASNTTSKMYNINFATYADAYDADDFNCMVQQALAIYMGWADQIEPTIVEDNENMYVMNEVL